MTRARATGQELLSRPQAIYTGSTFIEPTPVQESTGFSRFVDKGVDSVTASADKTATGMIENFFKKIEEKIRPEATPPIVKPGTGVPFVQRERKAAIGTTAVIIGAVVIGGLFLMRKKKK
jgi:hypothetical protein